MTKYCVTLLTVLFAALGAGAFELDERPAEPGDWGYRPAEGTTPTFNPPGFTWRPVKGAANYVLQVGTDRDCSEVAYEAADLPWNAHCPPTTFTPGVYYWRYAAVDKDGNRTAWSQARRFDASVTAVEMPRPTMSDLLARMPKEHPRLFFRPEEVPALKDLAAGSLAARWKDIQSQADKLLTSPPDLTEPPLYPPDVEVKSGEWKKIWWGNRGRMIAVADGAATLAFAYRISGDEKYGIAARDLLLGLAKWDPQGATNYRYNDEAAMPALYMASRAYDWVYPILNESDRATIVAMMRERGTQAFNHLIAGNFLWQPYKSHSNRAWHFLGEVAVAFQGEIPEAERWLDYAMTIYYTVYPVWGDDDGGWHEGVSYWISYTDRFTWWIEIVRSAFGIDTFERPFYRRVGFFPMYVMPPGSKTGGFGDQAELASSDKAADLVSVLAAGARNPYWQWYAETCGGDPGSGYLGFLFARRASDLPAKPPADLPSSVCFRGIGVAVLNTNLLDGTQNVQVHFKSSPAAGTHSHGFNRNNTFLINLHGQRAFLSSGRRDVHGSPHHTQWMWETKAQNGILVNGRGQLEKGLNSLGRITAFATSPTVDVVEGETKDEPSGLQRWRRRIVFFKPGTIVIHDLLDTAEPSTFQWLLHAKGPFELGANAALWKGEPGTLNVRWLEPQGLTLTQTDQYDVPPAEWTGWNLNEWHLKADSQEPVAHREFMTLVTVDGTPVPEASVTKDAGNVGSILLDWPDRQTRIVSKPGGFSVETPEFQQNFGPDSEQR